MKKQVTMRRLLISLNIIVQINDICHVFD
jgi:hypothetical protein